jgi:hypothetical protein
VLEHEGDALHEVDDMRIHGALQAMQQVKAEIVAARRGARRSRRRTAAELRKFRQGDSGSGVSNPRCPSIARSVRRMCSSCRALQHRRGRFPVATVSF